MARSHLVLLLLPLLLGAVAGCAAPGPDNPASDGAPSSPDWSFSLDGTPFDGRVLSMDGDPARPLPGDLVEVGEWLFPLEERGPHDFVADLRGATALALRKPDGTLRRVALVLDESGLGVAALAAMSDAEARALRGLLIEAWSEEAARQVARLDGERLAVVFAPVGRGTPLPVLPPGIPWFAVREASSGRAGSLENLAGLRSLRFLRVKRYAVGEDFDAALLDGMDSLARLDLSRLDIGNADLLGTLPSLRVLDLTRCGVPWTSGEKEPLSVHFARRLTRLRTLVLSESTAVDLAPLGGHPSLEEVRADGLALAALPTVPLPALRSLRILGTTAGEEGLAAFRAANPAAAVVTSWKEILLAAVAGADRVLLRSGGTCHRSGSEPILFESRDPEEIRHVLDAVVVSDPASGGRCMCCGDPTIEFRRGATLLAELGMHHGANLRWPDGWPGDGALTAESRDLLTEWMADRGAPGPLADWRKDRARVRSARARWDLLLARMPPPVAALLEKGTDRAGLAASIRAALPDPIPRAILCLRLYGTGEGTWIHPFGPDFVVEKDLLPEIPARDLREALWTAPADPALADGAARWLFAENRIADLDGPMTERILPVLGERALAHPRAFNRRRTLDVLGGSGTAEATVLLRRFLDPGIPARPLAEELVEEPFEGLVPPRIGDVYADFSDRAFAAILLARRGDRESLPAIRSLRATAPEEDRGVLDEAIGLLAR